MLKMHVLSSMAVVALVGGSAVGAFAKGDASVASMKTAPAVVGTPLTETAPGTSVSAGAPATGAMSGPEHGMPPGFDGGDGERFTGNPDLDANDFARDRRCPIGQFSFETALASLVGPAAATTEETKLSKQYGAGAFLSFVLVQDFAVNDAVKLASAARVHFPTPTLTGTDLAKRVVSLGLVDDTFYEGYQLDHLVSTAIDDQVMTDIDTQYGAPVDANFHKIADQAHYDLAQLLGDTDVKLARTTNHQSAAFAGLALARTWEASVLTSRGSGTSRSTRLLQRMM